MQVLTPSGYVAPSTLANGAAVCAFDADNAGIAIVNTVETIDFVDHAEWRRWWALEAEVPSFDWYRINGRYLLFREQSVWRNGANVCHARDLVVGDVIYDDQDQPDTVASIEKVNDDSLVWYRFEISGDHSYIVDGLTVHNASRFWVGGTGTWDSSTTTPWAASSGGAGGNSVPGSADSVTLDGNSGGGTVTVNFGGAVTIQSLTMGAFAGTFDNSVNNNNFTLNLSATSNVFNGSGNATRTYKLGTATYTLSGTNAGLNFGTVGNLTFSGNTGATVSFTGSGIKTFVSGNITWGTVSFGATPTYGYCQLPGGSCTISTLNFAAPNYVLFAAGVALTITNPVNWAGSSGSEIGFVSNSIGSPTTYILSSAGGVASWCSFRDISFSSGSNSLTATSSFDHGNNSSVTITPPSSGGGGSPSFSATIF